MNARMTPPPGTILGYTKRGLPIKVQAGGSGGPPELPTPQPPAPVTPGVFTQEQLFAAIEKARSEEKAKLYPHIEGLKTQFGDAQEQLRSLQQAEEGRQAQAKDEADRLTAAQKAADDEKLSLKDLIAKRDREAAEYAQATEAKFGLLQEELNKRDAMLQKEREFAELTNYKVARVAELKEPHPEQNHFGIADEFLDLVTGKTREEVDASISTMIAKTRSIVEGMQQAQVSARAAMPGVSPNTGNFGPVEGAGTTRQYSADEILAMDPDSKEYAALRDQYGIGRSPGNRGMFGESNRGYFG